ncbi:MAG: hypothetical protein QNJ54_18795 [Prochloraceae cyanobacterium]|nr:hypothetical protein [Prochloraceae cyanobacterium]
MILTPQVEVALYPDLGEPLTIPLDKIHGGEEFKIDVIDLRLPAGRLEKTLEAERIILECSVKKGEKTLEQVKKEVNLLAYNDYSLKELYLELLTCFVTPNHPVIMQVLKQVREVLKRNTGNNSLHGYQGSSQDVYEMTKALYETFKDFGISYINPPASFEGNQKIRFPDRVLIDQMGTCLDLSVLACACLEQMGLDPLIIVVSGHAFIGVWLEEEQHNYNPVIDEPFKLTNLIQAESLLLFDSSSYAFHPQLPFEAAIREAISYLNNKPLIGAVDIRICRKKGYKPLPIRMDAIATPEIDRQEITKSNRFP